MIWFEKGSEMFRKYVLKEFNTLKLVITYSDMALSCMQLCVGAYKKIFQAKKNLITLTLDTICHSTKLYLKKNLLA